LARQALSEARFYSPQHAAARVIDAADFPAAAAEKRLLPAATGFIAFTSYFFARRMPAFCFSA